MSVQISIPAQVAGGKNVHFVKICRGYIYLSWGKSCLKIFIFVLFVHQNTLEVRVRHIIIQYFLLNATYRVILELHLYGTSLKYKVIYDYTIAI